MLIVGSLYSLLPWSKNYAIRYGSRYNAWITSSNVGIGWKDRSWAPILVDALIKDVEVDD